MVKFVGEALDNGADYEQPVLKTLQGGEIIWDYFQFVIDATPRHQI